MQASKDREYYDFNTIQTEYGDLLKSAIIFGANASGKTNLIKALDYMGAIVLSKSDYQSDFIKNTPYFYLNDNAAKKPITFEVEFLQDGLVFTYGFEIKNNEINNEYLYRKNKKKTLLFTRSSPDFHDISLSKDMDNVKNFLKNTRRDNLFLHWAIWGNNDIAMKVYNWFSRLEIYSSDEISNILTSTVVYLEENKEGKDNLLDLLQKADIDILDFELEKKHNGSKAPLDQLSTRKEKQKGTADFMAIRACYNDNKEPVNQVRFNINMESAGTKKLFELAGPLLLALEKGKVILIDEIDTNLHPLLVRNLVMMFNSVSKNPNNAQLICNTHSTLLLEEEIRRDQVYFTEKDEYGASSLYSLADFKGVKKDSKLLKRYLLGVFGAIPDLQEFYIGKRHN